MDIGRSFYYVLPQAYRKTVEKEAEAARIPSVEHTTFRIYVIYLVAMGVAAIFLPFSILLRAIAFGVSVPIGLFLPYLYFTTQAEKRKDQVEEVLPDALLLMSANLRSGLTIDKAFLLSARDEFGPLANDIRATATDMFSGVPPRDAFRNLRERTNSELFSETLRLIINGLESGGDIAQLLDNSAHDIRETLNLQKETAARVATYSIFISMAAIGGAPFLFAVSNFLISRVTGLFADLPLSVEDLPQTGIFSFSAPDINLEFFRLFAIASIMIINGFGALIMAEIKYGSYKKGIKLVPVFIVIALAIFFAADFAIQQTLSGAIAVGA